MSSLPLSTFLPQDDPDEWQPSQASAAYHVLLERWRSAFSPCSCRDCRKSEPPQKQCWESVDRGWRRQPVSPIPHLSTRRKKTKQKNTCTRSEWPTLTTGGPARKRRTTHSWRGAQCCCHVQRRQATFCHIRTAGHINRWETIVIGRANGTNASSKTPLCLESLKLNCTRRFVSGEIILPDARYLLLVCFSDSSSAVVPKQWMTCKQIASLLSAVFNEGGPAVPLRFYGPWPRAEKLTER